MESNVLNVKDLILSGDGTPSLCLMNEQDKIVLFNSPDELIDAIIEHGELKKTTEKMLVKSANNIKQALVFLYSKENLVHYIFDNLDKLEDNLLLHSSENNVKNYNYSKILAKLDEISLNDLFFNFVNYCIASGMYRKEIVNILSDTAIIDYIDNDKASEKYYDWSMIDDIYSDLLCSSLNLDYEIPYELFSFMLSDKEQLELNNIIKNTNNKDGLYKEPLYIKSRVLVINKILELANEIRK